MRSRRRGATSTHLQRPLHPIEELLRRGDIRERLLVVISKILLGEGGRDGLD